MNKSNFLCIIFVVICLLPSCSKDNEGRIIDSESDDPAVEESKPPQLLSFGFKAHDNPYHLSSDVKGEVEGDSVIECWIPNIVEDKMLTVKIASVADSVIIDGHRYVDGGGKFDFKAPVWLSLFSSGIEKRYHVFVNTFTGLPIIWIETEWRKEITSKDEYVNATFKLVENVVTRSAGDIIEDSVKIKGRGNSSWNNSPKKSFSLKFEKKRSILDEPKDKSWLLIANYFDKTMLRNKTAFLMGEMSNLDYTPRCHFSELILNGRYHGTYLLCEKLKISKDRVDVGDDGFLLEVDERAEGEKAIFFKTKYLPQPVNIKDPDVAIGDTAYNYVKDYVTMAEAALYSDDFKDSDRGWQKYMDLDSFVDWYLINEIARNGDAVLYTSCYMNLKKGGKLKMGPIWDFDVSMGNNYEANVYPTKGWYIKNASWFTRLFEDPNFVKKVKERFAYFYSRRNDIFINMNEYSHYLRFAVEENNNKWGTFYNYTFPNHDIWGNYQNEVQLLKQWIYYRFEWLKSEFDKM